MMQYTSAEMIEFLIASMPDDARTQDVDAFRSVLETLVQVASEETVQRIARDLEVANTAVGQNTGGASKAGH